MRLVAWNVNYNNKRRPFRDTVALVAPLCADVLILSEIASPEGQDQKRGVHWIGDASPGIAVVFRDGLEVRPHPMNASAPRLSGGFSFCGDVSFDLLVAWPVQRGGKPPYHDVLMQTLKHFEDMLNSRRTVLAGDLNTSSRVQAQRLTHSAFVNGAAAFELVSAYHEQTAESHGKETVATYRHGPSDESLFHIDYCFVPKSVAAATNISVLRGSKWGGLSDHFPLVVDIPDVAIRQLAL